MKFGELQQRVDSLVALNEIVNNAQYNTALVQCSNELS
jgi:hypothetical protein